VLALRESPRQYTANESEIAAAGAARVGRPIPQSSSRAVRSGAPGALSPKGPT
jgi:hypothetical protein